MKKVILGLIMTVSFPAIAMANYGGVMGSQRMMWGYHAGEWGMIIHGLYSLVCLGLIMLFFWLLFRIARALEDIARTEKNE